MALLQLERISAQYPGAAEPVLADISLSLGSQQLLVALGPSGSGKTSLLNLIAGFVSPSAGRITLDGVQAGLQEVLVDDWSRAVKAALSGDPEQMGRLAATV